MDLKYKIAELDSLKKESKRLKKQEKLKIKLETEFAKKQAKLDKKKVVSEVVENEQIRKPTTEKENWFEMEKMKGKLETSIQVGTKMQEFAAMKPKDLLESSKEKDATFELIKLKNAKLVQENNELELHAKMLIKEKDLNVKLKYRLEKERKKRTNAEKRASKAEKLCQYYKQKMIATEKEIETKFKQQMNDEQYRINKHHRLKEKAKAVINKKNNFIESLKTQVNAEREMRVVAESQAINAERWREDYRQKTHKMEKDFEIKTKTILKEQSRIIREYGINQTVPLHEKDLRERLITSESENNRKDNLLHVHELMNQKEERLKDLIASVDQKMNSLDMITVQYKDIKEQLDQSLMQLELVVNKHCIDDIKNSFDISSRPLKFQNGPI